MSYILEVFRRLPRQGPGCREATLRALDTVKPHLPERPVVLDAGCGSGASTRVLAEAGLTPIYALDLDLPLLKRVPNSRIQGDLGGLPFAEQSFDLIWSEGAVYTIGFENALYAWRDYLRPGGCMAATDLTWMDEDAPEEIRSFWDANYPDMKTATYRMRQAEALGYSTLDVFPLPREAWTWEYYEPMKAQLDDLQTRYPDDQEAKAVVETLSAEIDMFERYGPFYNYVFYVLKS